MKRIVGLELLSDRQWCRKLFFFYKVINNMLPIYLTAYLSNNTPPSLDTKMSYKNAFRTILSRVENFKNTFYPYFISDWNKLHPVLKKSTYIQSLLL